jgi:Uma2 family endonuclease
VSNARAAEVFTEANIKGVPEIVVEILSKSTRRRDESIKRRLYERTGVSEYWVVDPVANTIRVYQRTGEAFAGPAELSQIEGHVLTTPLLPGLEMPLARIFR